MSFKTASAGKWLIARELIKEKWDAITDNEIEMIDGKRQNLIDALVSKYGMSKKNAVREVNRFWR